MDTIISNQDACYKPATFVIARTDLSVIDPGTLRLGDAEISGIFPPLCRQNHIIADPDLLRPRDADISPTFPLLCRPDCIISDPGRLRLGDAEISMESSCF